MSITDDVESIERVGTMGDSYILRKRGTNIYGILNKDRFLELGIKYVETMKAIADELYGPFIKDLSLLARIAPEAIIKAAKDKNWSVEEDDEKVNMFISKKLSQDDGILITFIPPVTALDFFDYYDEGSISINYTMGKKSVHAKNTPEEKLPDITLGLKELIELARKYTEVF